MSDATEIQLVLEDALQTNTRVEAISPQPLSLPVEDANYANIFAGNYYKSEWEGLEIDEGVQAGLAFINKTIDDVNHTNIRYTETDLLIALNELTETNRYLFHTESYGQELIIVSVNGNERKYIRYNSYNVFKYQDGAWIAIGSGGGGGSSNIESNNLIIANSGTSDAGIQSRIELDDGTILASTIKFDNLVNEPIVELNNQSIKDLSNKNYYEINLDNMYELPAVGSPQTFYITANDGIWLWLEDESRYIQASIGINSIEIINGGSSNNG